MGCGDKKTTAQEKKKVEKGEKTVHGNKVAELLVEFTWKHQAWACSYRIFSWFVVAVTMSFGPVMPVYFEKIIITFAEIHNDGSKCRVFCLTKIEDSL